MKSIEALLQKTVEYGKTSLELAKLKTVDKTADVGSSFITHSVAFVLILTFIIFISIGASFWLGEILGKTWYGFFIVAEFYGILGLILHFFLHKRVKRFICNSIIKQTLS